MKNGKHFPLIRNAFLPATWTAVALIFSPILSADEQRGDQMLQSYFAAKTAEVEKQSSVSPSTDPKVLQENLQAWRQQLQEMLGLSPWPVREDLQTTVTATRQHGDITVDNLHFQSIPGLYVTGNLYRPTHAKEKLPAILYLCGHAKVEENGISMGNKTAYHHHGAWFARNGYVCLTIDTVQLGEIAGEHHGTFRLGKWWWASQGYTPAGVEAWNAIRALDLLAGRSDVDPLRIGVTGRSGGGAYTWWVAALDERVAVAAPTAGITTMRNHVVDGCIEGHCDCMFMNNYHRWDFNRVAALVAPRPLLILNTDRDTIFPLDGVFQVYQDTRNIYRLLGKEGLIGFHIAEGPHADIQPLNIGAFHWMERHLKKADITSTIQDPAEKSMAASDLRVFSSLPVDEINTTIDQRFVPSAPPPKIASMDDWTLWLTNFRERLKSSLSVATSQSEPNQIGEETTVSLGEDAELATIDFVADEPWNLRLHILRPQSLPEKGIDRIILHVLSPAEWPEFPKKWPQEKSGSIQNEAEWIKWAAGLYDKNQIHVWFAPRGVGPTAWSDKEPELTHIKRRFLLLGESWEITQLGDILSALEFLRQKPEMNEARYEFHAEGAMSALCLYAAASGAQVEALRLTNTPASHKDDAAPIIPGILRFGDLSQVLAVARQNSRIILINPGKELVGFAETYRQYSPKAHSLEVEARAE
jgi:cephalosporin-C deacetylase-like acetyl esterase